MSAQTSSDDRMAYSTSRKHSHTYLISMLLFPLFLQLLCRNLFILVYAFDFVCLLLFEKQILIDLEIKNPADAPQSSSIDFTSISPTN